LGLFFAGLWVVYEGPTFLRNWEPEQRIVLWIFGCLWLVGACFSVFSFEEVIVDRYGMEIRSLLWKYTRDQNYFENGLVRNLRYEQWSGGEGEPLQNGLRFEYKSQTFTFALRLGEEECQELVKSMRQIHAFQLQDPAYPAVN